MFRIVKKAVIVVSLMLLIVLSGCELEEEMPDKQYGSLDNAAPDELIQACADSEVDMYVMRDETVVMNVAFADFFGGTDILAFLGHTVEVTGEYVEFADGCELYEIDSIGRIDI